MKRNLHNFILMAITAIAAVVLFAAPFAMFTWPNKAFAALIIASTWLIVFIEINSKILLKED